MIGEPLRADVEADVVVIGGGLAGATAALAARRRGRSVVVVRRSLGLTALSSGALQVGELPGERRPDHPYAVLGESGERVAEALSFLHGQLEGAIALAPMLLLSPAGALVRAAGAVDTVAPGDLAGASGTVVLVGIPASPAADAAVLARAAQEAAERAGLALRFQGRALDRPAWTGLRPHQVAELAAADVESLAGEVAALLPAGTTRVLLPPFVGPAAAAISARLGVPCGEWLAAPPSLPGLRLQRALDLAMRRAGAAIVNGEAYAQAGTIRVRDPAPALTPASDFDPGAPPEPARPVASHAVRGSIVLATGRFVGGGILRERRLREPVLDLPVWLEGQVDEGRFLGDFTSYELAADQPAFRAGLRIDAALRPLHRDGSPADVLACGDVIGGTDPAVDGTWAGVAVLTGYLAGSAA